MNINLPPLAAGQSGSGMMGADQVAELQKALTAGYGTDVAGLTGGAALRIQSLEQTMLSTIQENKHFVLFNALQKANATATVDEWTEQSGVGGFLGGSTNSETGNIAAATGAYARRVGLVKYLMTRREVSLVQSLQNALADSEAVEQSNGALQLLSDAEYLSFEGDSDVVPTEFDGINKQIDSLNDTTHVIDARLVDWKLNSYSSVMAACQTISAFGNFGTPTDIFLSQQAQADLDLGLEGAYRVALTSNPTSLTKGAPVVGIRTSFGDVATKPDVFIRDEVQKTTYDSQYPAVATAQVAIKPQAVSPSVAGTAADSNFVGAAYLGTYYYAVAGINASGQSGALLSTQVTLVSGHTCVLTITGSAGAGETGYVIYRGARNGPNLLSDMREMKRIPVTLGGTTTFTDKNFDVPGTTNAYILNLASGAKAITWRQLLPMMKFPLYPTVSATIPWAQLLFGYLRLGKRKHHVRIKNIVASGAVWKPFP